MISARNNLSGKPSGATATILIVEDERILAHDLQATLGRLGYQVCGVAQTGVDAIKRVMSDRPDLVLMDIRLKGPLDGVRTSEEILRHVEVPIVYLTAHDDDSTVDRAKATEPYGYLIKPFDERELRVAVEMALSKFRTERRLREQEAWLSTTLESIGDAVLATDAAGKVVFLNPAAEEVTGWAKQDAVGRSVDDVLPLDPPPSSNVGRVSRDAVLRRRVVERPAARAGRRTSLQTRSGTERAIDETSSPIRDQRGHVHGSVIVFRDVSERRSTQEALARSEARNRALLEAVPDAIINARADGTVTEYKPARGAVRVSSERPPMLAEVVPPGLAPAFVQHIGRALRAGKTETLEFDEAGLPEGPRHYEARFVPAGNDDVIVIVRDTTERKRIQSQLLIADRMASLGLMVAGLAHEINNPLAALGANLSFLDETIAEAGATIEIASLRGPLASALEAMDRVRRVVQDLRAFSRIDEGRVGSVDVWSVLDSAVGMAGHELRQRARLVTERVPVPPVRANSGRLGQVFLNLLINASQALEEGAPERNEVRITTGTDAEGRVVVAVRDTGSGIAPEHRDRIFDPFFTTKPVGIGTGLGLAICHGIVKGFGGEVAFTSATGRGSTFTVTLPTASSARPPAPTRPPSPKRSGRLLVVDDEQMICSALTHALASEYEVTAVTDARQALALLAAGAQFDVILSDVMMPGMSGVAFYEELARRDPAVADRIVFFTGGTFNPQVSAFLAETPNARIDKPFDLRELRALLRSRL